MTNPATSKVADWADTPLNMDGAAVALGISRRTLTDAVKSLPYYELRGRNKKVFYPEHIQQLRRGMNRCALQSNGLMDGHTFTALAPMAVGSDALSELAMLAKQPRKPRK